MMNTRNMLSAVGNILLLPVYALTHLLPRRSGTVVIGSNSGEDFADNAKYLLQYHLKDAEADGLDFLWVSRSREVLTYLEGLGINCAHVYAWKSIWKHLTCRVICFTHKNLDYFPALSGGATVVALWHGFPLKRIGPEPDYLGMTPKQIRLRKLFYSIFPYLYYMNCDVVINPYPKYDYIYRKCFSIAQPLVVSKQQPRVSALQANFFSPLFFEEELQRLDVLKAAYSSVFCWMPTHRMHRKDFNFFEFLEQHNFSFKALNDQLKLQDALLLLKLHPVEASTLADAVANFSNIKLYTYSDPYPLLSRTDVLITDFSSIAIDFCVLERPILFFQLDKAAYLAEIGLYVEASEIIVGASFAFTFADFLQMLDAEKLPKARLLASATMQVEKVEHKPGKKINGVLEKVFNLWN